MRKVSCHLSSQVSNSETTIIFQKSAYVSHTVLSNIIFSQPFHLSWCMFVLPSWNINYHCRKCINNDEFGLRNYFPLLKNKQQVTPRNRIVEVLSNSSLHKPNTHKTHWISSELFVQSDVTNLSTCTKFCHTSVTRVRERK